MTIILYEGVNEVWGTDTGGIASIWDILNYRATRAARIL